MSLKFFQCRLTARLRHADSGLKGAVKFGPFNAQGRVAVGLIVQKFGGTSVGSVERIRNVARRVAKWKAAGHDLVVVFRLIVDNRSL